jgi:hypothetical protein
VHATVRRIVAWAPKAKARQQWDPMMQFAYPTDQP